MSAKQHICDLQQCHNTVAVANVVLYSYRQRWLACRKQHSHEQLLLLPYDKNRK